MKVPIEKMMEMIEASVKEFNLVHRETRSIESTFISAGQHPWRDCTKAFEAHLEKLSRLPLCGGCASERTIQQALMDLALESRAEERLPEGELAEEDVVEEDARENNGDAAMMEMSAAEC